MYENKALGVNMGSGLERDSNYFGWLDDRTRGVQMKDHQTSGITSDSEILSNEGEEMRARSRKEPTTKVRKLAQSWAMARQAEIQSRRALWVASLSLATSLLIAIAYLVH